jgi:predicted MFS family arabinose efflux permease
MALLGLLVGMEFMENAMFVFSAGHITGEIAAGPREFARVQAAYAVGSMLMIVLQQSASRHFGYRRYLVGAVALFTLGAFGSALSDTLTGLTVARLVQGLGGGALFTSARVLVPLLFAPADRPRAIAYFMLILFGLSAVGPALAGILVDGPGWSWIFVAVIPLGLLAIAGTWFLLPDDAGRGGEPVQWPAGPLLVVGAALTLLQLALSEARYAVFADPLPLLAGALAGLALLAWFVHHQWRHPSPFMRLSELRHPGYLLGLVLYFLHYLLSNSSGYVFPIFAERALGLHLVTVGWLNTLAALVSLFSAWAYLRVGPKLRDKRPLMAAGALLLALSAWLFQSTPPDVPPGALLLPLLAKGLFGTMLVLPVAGLTFRELGEHRFAHGYQGKNLMRQLAASFASAVSAVTLEDRQFADRAQLAALADPARPGVADWVSQAQAHYEQQGLAAPQAHAAALAALGRTVDQQSQLMACDDLYRVIAVVALLTAAIVLLQRRLK